MLQKYLLDNSITAQYRHQPIFLKKKIKYIVTNPRTKVDVTLSIQFVILLKLSDIKFSTENVKIRN